MTVLWKIAATDGEKRNTLSVVSRLPRDAFQKSAVFHNGKVTCIVDFGAFVAIGGGKEGLVHISQIADKRAVEKVTHLFRRWVRKSRLRFWKLTAVAV